MKWTGKREIERKSFNASKSTKLSSGKKILNNQDRTYEPNYSYMLNSSNSGYRISLFETFEFYNLFLHEYAL